MQVPLFLFGTVDVKVPRADAPSILGKIRSCGYKALCLDSDALARQVVGIGGLQPIRSSDFPLYYGRNTTKVDRIPQAELFTKDGDLFYVTIAPVDSDRSGSAPGVETGLMTLEQDGATERLAEFRSFVVSAITNIVDGRRIRHASFEWTSLVHGNRAKNLLKASVASEKVTYIDAHLDEAQVEAAHLLKKSATRELLQTVAKSGFVREDGLMEAVGEKAVVELDRLINSHLLSKNTQIVCAKRGKVLGYIGEGSSVDSATLCPYCRTPWTDEQSYSCYMSTELASSLVTSSNWMTILITEVLVKNRVPESRIFWNVIRDGEEIDIFCQVGTEVWVFELKDRDFGTADLRSLTMKVPLFEPDRIFIVSTGKIMKDLPRTLPILKGFNQRQIDIFGIETMELAERQLPGHIYRSSISAMSDRLGQIATYAGLDLNIMLAQRFARKVNPALAVVRSS